MMRIWSYLARDRMNSSHRRLSSNRAGRDDRAPWPFQPRRRANRGRRCRGAGLVSWNLSTRKVRPASGRFGSAPSSTIAFVAAWSAPLWVIRQCLNEPSRPLARLAVLFSRRPPRLRPRTPMARPVSHSDGGVAVRSPGMMRHCRESRFGRLDDPRTRMRLGVNENLSCRLARSAALKGLPRRAVQA